MSYEVVLENLNADLAKFRAQRDQFQVNLQQSVGAVYGVEQAIAAVLEQQKAECAKEPVPEEAPVEDIQE